MVPLCRSSKLVVITGLVLIFVLLVVVLILIVLALILVLLIILVLIILVLVVLILVILILVIHMVCDAFSHVFYSGFRGRNRRLSANAPFMWYCLTKGTIVVCRDFIPLCNLIFPLLSFLYRRFGYLHFWKGCFL